MNNQKQKIRTISAKALFKYFPKKKEDKSYAIYLINKALCRYVIKQEEDMCKRQVLFHKFWHLIFHKKRQLKFHTYLVFYTRGFRRGLYFI